MTNHNWGSPPAPVSKTGPPDIYRFAQFLAWSVFVIAALTALFNMISVIVDESGHFGFAMGLTTMLLSLGVALIASIGRKLNGYIDRKQY